MWTKQRLTDDESFGEVHAGEHTELRVAALDERHEMRRCQSRPYAVCAAGAELASMAGGCAALGLVIIAHVYDGRWLRGFIDEVVGRHLRFPRFALCLEPAQPCVEDGLGQHLAGGTVIGMPIGPVRQRHRPRTNLPD